ncbi:MAG: CcmD family protein [Gemmatimonadetes bacterium]|nr:CcmD family protein [Gemmatimonadota bacterium]MBT7864533.1 CcmD family protein [Gemmatimonadota bacterium]
MSLETDAGLGYLAIAYGAFFIALFVYVMRLRRRDQELTEQLEQLAEKIHQKSS